MTKLEQLLDVLHESVSLSTGEELRAACELIISVQSMSSGNREVMRAVYNNGPVCDDDIPSKHSRDQLLAEGLIVKVVVRGEEGYNACTYRGAMAFRLIQAGA